MFKGEFTFKHSSQQKLVIMLQDFHGFFHLEIKNLESAKSAADEVSKIVETNGLNLLINNAGKSRLC